MDRERVRREGEESKEFHPNLESGLQRKIWP